MNVKTRRTVVALACLAAFPVWAQIPHGGVPTGCDPSVMSEDYWKIWNAEEQAKIDADIETNRKSDFEVEIGKKGGCAVPAGAEVLVEQLDHDFRFGAHIFNFNQLGKTEYNDAYKASYGRGGLFNQATVAFYWADYEPIPGKLRAFGGFEDTEDHWNGLGLAAATHHPLWRRPAPGPVIGYLKSRDVAVHGHILIWGSYKPSWIYDWYCPEGEKRALEALGVPRHGDFREDGKFNDAWKTAWRRLYETMSEREIAARAPAFVAKMKEFFSKRVRDVAGDFGEVADSWDVVNESVRDWRPYGKSRTELPVWKSRYGLMPGDYPLQALLDAKDAMSPAARLAINDNEICADFLSQVKDLEKNGARIDIVGCQMHIFDTNDCMRLAKGAKDVTWVGTPQIIQRRLDLMAKTGRPLHVSEVTITSPGADAASRQIQAILARNIYRKWFSHKAVMGITWWNTVDGGGVFYEPKVSGLFTRDMRKKPSYLALDELINREWKTKLKVKVAGRDGNGGARVKFRGFRGKYRLSWTDAQGKGASKEVYLK